MPPAYQRRAAMQRNAKSDTNREVLKRILALLFALAGLAERSSGRCYPVRLLVLSILRPAEAVAWNLVIGEAYALGASPRLPVWAAAHGGDNRCGCNQAGPAFPGACPGAEISAGTGWECAGLLQCPTGRTAHLPGHACPVGGLAPARRLRATAARHVLRALPKRTFSRFKRLFDNSLMRVKWRCFREPERSVRWYVSTGSTENAVSWPQR